MTSRLQGKYLKEVVPALQARFDLKNKMAVPRVIKVTLNSGIGKFKGEEKVIEEIAKDLGKISGQKAVFAKAKKAISSFKTRIGQPIGLRVTLRGKRMYDFVDRLISLALPRTRDFRGLARKSVDKKGNLNIGIKEQIVFPEISHENVKTIFGFEVCLTTNAKNQEEGWELFKLLGFPMRKD